MSPKSPRIQLSNDMFAERKCCQVFAYESETFHCRRSHGISHCQNGEQKPQKPPIPLAWCGPSSNTAMPWSTSSTTPNCSSDGWGTVAHWRREVPVGYNGVLQIRPEKYPFPWTDRQTPLPASSLDLSDLWCQTVSGSDLLFFHIALDRQMDIRTYIWPHVRTYMHPYIRLTERRRESLTTIGRCTLWAMRPNNIHICIAPYCHNFRGTEARQCASERKKRKESKPGTRGMSLA